jgi:hypothetical protein
MCFIYSLYSSHKFAIELVPRLTFNDDIFLGLSP